MLQKLRTTVKEDLETPLKKFQDSQPPTFTHTSHSNQSSTTTTGTSKCPATIQSSKVTKPCTSPTISSEEHHRANKRPVSVYRSSSRSYRRDFFDFVLYHAPLAIISKRMILLTNPGRHNPTTGRPNPMAGPSPNTAKGGLIPVISNKTTRKGKPPIRAGGMHRTTSPMILTISYNTQPSTAARPSAAPIQHPRAVSDPVTPGHRCFNTLVAWKTSATCFCIESAMVSQLRPTQVSQTVPLQMASSGPGPSSPMCHAPSFETVFIKRASVLDQLCNHKQVITQRSTNPIMSNAVARIGPMQEGSP